MDNVVEHTTTGDVRRTHTISVRTLDPKNINGDFGERCDYCSGLGFTNFITGGSKTCGLCEGTGIKTNKVAMQKQIDSLTQVVINLNKEIKELKKI